MKLLALRWLVTASENSQGGLTPSLACFPLCVNHHAAHLCSPHCGVLILRGTGHSCSLSTYHET